MRTVSAAELRSVLHHRMLIERLRQSFRAGVEAPPAHRHRVETYGASDATLLLAPAWQVNQSIGLRIDTDFPDNSGGDLPQIQGVYLLADGKTGVPQALLESSAALARRSGAAASALAASYLARPDAERLLVVGTGSLALELVEAHAAVRTIRHVLVWGRDLQKAKRLAARFHRPKFRIEATSDLEGAVRGADIVACATAAREPLIHGDWLRPGQHLDLLGGVTPEMREADDGCIRRSRVFVDCRNRTPVEAGDISQPLASGLLTADDIAGDLFDLGRGERAGRRFYDQITLFKSVGTALADLCAAQMAVEMVLHNDSIR
ncbi:ornithine cyclodeaminase family protein [Azospirillum ramasamyi]|uniref:Ornithine cyclodeaminase family protein n=1 Tax=Azospirillum ramasamyi TaxID=682998 RepID=A0A2U9S9S7_9PROT|nr:ornithine cyclodeaminase family protein [Azospirillum ramasamyi]AWU94678.1 ornithine cyclodeaminase family protein [Azospirillum ramasamyi]